MEMSACYNACRHRHTNTLSHKDTIMKTYVVLCISDILLSYYMFTCGLSYEENPIAKCLYDYYGVWSFVVLKVISILLLAYISKITNKGVFIYRCANILTGCVVAYSVFLCCMIWSTCISFYIFVLKHKLGLLGG